MNTPDSLFHYTNASALLSIVTTRQLWASRADFTNDPQEGKQVKTVLENICNQPLIHYPNKQINPKYLEALKWSLHLGAQMSVISFSRHPHSLTMCRLYCPPLGGYVIGIPKNVLDKVGTLVEVQYTETALMQWAHNYSTEYFEHAATHDRPEISAEDLNREITRTTDLIGRRTIADLTFKSTGFIEEGETRLIIRKGENPYKHRVSKDGSYIVPYLEIDMPNEPIGISIFSGPNKHPDLARETEAMLRLAAMSAGTKWDICIGGGAIQGYRS